MRFSLPWLGDFLETRRAPTALADALTGLGFETELASAPAADWQGLEIAEVLAVRPHPNADRLRLADVRSRRDRATLVCGAPNLQAGMKTIWAQPGARLPQSGARVETAEIRGEASRGMLCSEYELGLSEAHEGIVVLPPPTRLSASAAAALGLGDELLDVAVMPNRGDAMSVYGVARELAAAGLGRLKASPLTPALYAQISQGAPSSRSLTIEASARRACPHFALCALSDLTVRPAPPWLQQRLRAAGLKPQSAPVDITNYVALSFGHPMHVYDADRVEGGICVRLAGARAAALHGLDGRDYRLAAEDCVIADATKVLGIGGVMGGAESGCTPKSRRLLLESAWFAPPAIARTGQRLNCVSQARQRYERGVDAALTRPALAWAAQQIQALCGGEIARPRTAGAPPAPARGAVFDLSLAARLLGRPLAPAAARRTLTALGFAVRPQSKQGKHSKQGKQNWHVRPPTWRYDMSSDAVGLAAELTEEVLRFADAADWPSVALPPRPEPPRLPASLQRVRRVRRHLALRGWDELTCWSFVSEAQAQAFDAPSALRLANPVSQDLAVMRPSLIPNLVLAVRKNLARRMDWLGPVQCCELGAVFGPRLGEQRQMAAGVCAPAAARDWQRSEGAPAMFFAMKAHALAVLQDLGVPPACLEVESAAPAYYAAGRSASLRCGDTTLAWCGVLGAEAARAAGVRGELGLMEIALDALDAMPQPAARAEFVRADYPLVRRDFAFACDVALPAAELLKAACAGEEAAIARAHIFDLFALPHAPQKKSLALEIVLAPRRHTLSDAEIQDFCARLVARVEERTGAVLRREDSDAPQKKPPA